jgi:beta-xylosidase
MKLLAVLTLLFVLSLATGFPWKHRKNKYERRRVSHRHSVKKEHKHETKHESAKARHHGSKTKAHKVYKKYGMFTAPSFALEDSSVAPQVQGGFQQVLVPVNSASFTQNTVTAPEMVSSFTAVPASQRATLATEVRRYETV